MSESLKPTTAEECLYTVQQEAEIDLGGAIQTQDDLIAVSKSESVNAGRLDAGADELTIAEARDILIPPKGLEVTIEDEEVAIETAQQLRVFRSVLTGEVQVDEQEKQDGTEESPLQPFNQLSDLATLFVTDEDFLALEEYSQSHGFSEELTTELITETKQAHLLRVAKILKYSFYADDLFKHTTVAMAEVVKSGSIKSRGKLMSEGKYFAGSGDFESGKARGANASPREIISAMEQDNSKSGYGTTTHSLLVHARQSTGVDNAGPAIYMRASSIIDQTPVIMPGQDQNHGKKKLTRLEGKDEAHGTNLEKQQYAAVTIKPSEEYLMSLPDIEDRVLATDITFMPTEPTADTAYDYEYSISNGFVLLSPYKEQIIELASRIDEDSPLRQVETIMPRLESGDLYKVGSRLGDLAASKAEGKADIPFRTAESKEAWESMLAELEVVEAFFKEAFDGVDGQDRALIYDDICQTAVLRYVLRQSGSRDDVVDSIFVSKSHDYHEKRDIVRSAMDKYLKSKFPPEENKRYVRYKKIKLGFNQTDMAKSVVREYATHHAA